GVTAEREGWPQDQWAGLIAPFLTGDPQKAYFDLPLEDAKNYDWLKAEVLSRLGVTVAVRAQRVHCWKYCPDQPPRSQMHDLGQLVKKWLQPETLTKEQMVERVVMDHYLRSLPKDLQHWVSHGDPKTAALVVEMVERYTVVEDLLRPASRRGPVLPPPVRPASVPQREASLNPGTSRHSQTQIRGQAAPVSGGCASGRGGRGASSAGARLSFLTDAGRLKQQQHTEDLVDWLTRPSSSSESSASQASSALQSTSAAKASNAASMSTATPAVASLSHMEESAELFDYNEKNSTPESSLKPQHAYNEDQPFSCPDCGEKFTDIIALKIHIRSHTGKKTFKCPECGKCFSKPSYLKVHRRIHTGEKLFKCQECEKCFTQVSNLAHHKRIHTGETFACPECGKCFIRASSLAVHERIHTGNTFPCSECGKCFTQASVLVNHKRIHSGEKPFKCPECGKGFNYASNLAKHTRCHTGEKPFKCPECGKCFTQSSSRARHKRMHTVEKNLLMENV
uniref:Uncharacterized protein n=1 Tax=Leptobrachium leishanense TaxID=445787 RepID=A0A8C5WFA9_9ANUR